jgi:hypothetical protein
MHEFAPPTRSRLSVGLSSLLDDIKRRFGLVTRDTPLPAQRITLDVDRPTGEPFAALLEDLKARLVGYSRAGWAVEVNELPCRPNDGHPTGPDGYWRRQPDRRLIVTLTLRPTR